MGDLGEAWAALDSEASSQPPTAFQLHELLGEGAFGCVHRALHLRSGRMVAIKQLPLGGGSMSSRRLRKEVELLSSARHEHIVAYHGAFRTSSELWIVMELAGDSLADVRGVTPLTEDHISAVCCCALDALAYLHSRRILHRDVKAANLLLSYPGQLKLADFGVATTLTSDLTHSASPSASIGPSGWDGRNYPATGRAVSRHTLAGSPYWMAPEVAQICLEPPLAGPAAANKGYGAPADVWSLGVTAIELAEGAPPLAEMGPHGAMHFLPLLPSPTLKKPLDYSACFSYFLSAALVKQPDRRADVAVLRAHEFYARGTAARGRGVLRSLAESVSPALVARRLLREREWRGQWPELDSPRPEQDARVAAAAPAGTPGAADPAALTVRQSSGLYAGGSPQLAASRGWGSLDFGPIQRAAREMLAQDKQAPVVGTARASAGAASPPEARAAAACAVAVGPALGGAGRAVRQTLNASRNSKPRSPTGPHASAFQAKQAEPPRDFVDAAEVPRRVEGKGTPLSARFASESGERGHAAAAAGGGAAAADWGKVHCAVMSGANGAGAARRGEPSPLQRECSGSGGDSPRTPHRQPAGWQPSSSTAAQPPAVRDSTRESSPGLLPLRGASPRCYGALWDQRSPDACAPVACARASVVTSTSYASTRVASTRTSVQSSRDPSPRVRRSLSLTRLRSDLCAMSEREIDEEIALLPVLYQRDLERVKRRHDKVVTALLAERAKQEIAAARAAEQLRAAAPLAVQFELGLPGLPSRAPAIPADSGSGTMLLAGGGGAVAVEAAPRNPSPPPAARCPPPTSQRPPPLLLPPPPPPPPVAPYLTPIKSQEMLSRANSWAEELGQLDDQSPRRNRTKRRTPSRELRRIASRGLEALLPRELLRTESRASVSSERSAGRSDREDGEARSSRRQSSFL